MSAVTVGCVVADNYADFMPAWLRSVQSLARRPDEVVVVTDMDWMPDWVRTVHPPGPDFDWPAWHSTLFDACETDWCAWVNADDRYLPHALDEWPDWDVDVAILGNQIWLGHDDVESMARVDYNHVPCGSAFRLAAYRRALPDGVPDFMPYSDWAMWAGLAKAGATFRCTDRVDYRYRVHPETPLALEPTRSLIRAWAAGL